MNDAITQKWLLKCIDFWYTFTAIATLNLSLKSRYYKTEFYHEYVSLKSEQLKT